jgi:fumarate reductase flavoprotein subunit
MVERCADCGFDLAGGRVEVVPTAHYFMGGVVCAPDTATELEGLFVAGEDAGGVHGANRLGGNGVANSTVFGGIAGDVMAARLGKGLDFRRPDEDALVAAAAAALEPFALPPGNPHRLRERLSEVMWDDAGVIRDAAGLARAEAALADIAVELAGCGLAESDRRFNLTWHDWLNLRSLVDISRIIVAAAAARSDSRGAHFRADNPATGDLPTSTFTVARRIDGRLAIAEEHVVFNRVRPGESLLDPAAGPKP